MDTNKKPNGCPKCKKFDICTLEPFNEESQSIRVECHNCGIIWNEVYKFHFWEMVEE